MDLQNPQTLELVTNIKAAITTTYDPIASPELRKQAFQLLENVKDNIEGSVTCGFCLAKQDNDPCCRHFGLQLLEFTIKYKWNDLPIDLKVSLKDGVMTYMAEGTLNIAVEQLYIKDKLSRLVVEMIKREWPQQWPSLLNELHDLSLKGPTQTELVLFVFLRLCEDVAILQNLESNIRRRDIYQELTTNMEDIIRFFLTCLQNYQSLYSQNNNNVECIQVIQCTLRTASSYWEWAPLEILFIENNQFLQCLCILLGDENFKMAACDCLLQIVSRKLKISHMGPFMFLFKEAAMTAIYNAAEKSCNSAVTEQEYNFFKLLTQVVTSLGSQLVSFWEILPNIETDSNFETYLRALLFFTKHPSLTVYNYTFETWNIFLKHKVISTNEKFKNVLPEFLAVVSRKIIKHGYPYTNCDASSPFSQHDFDKDQNYSMFFYKNRTNTLNLIKYATTTCPKIAYDLALEWFTKVITQTKPDNPLCNSMSLNFLEWEAMALFLEAVISRIMCLNETIATVENKRTLLEQCLALKTQDPLILSTQLTCISGLFGFLKDVPEALTHVLELIFSSMIFTQNGQTKDKSRAVKNVRRHAVSMLVNFAKIHPQILVPAFDELNGVFVKISDEMSPMERQTVKEAMVLLNNQFNNYDKQSIYLQNIMSPLNEQWLGIKEGFSSPAHYMAFIGLDKPPVDSLDGDLCGQNRSLIMCTLQLMIAMIKRSQIPTDKQKAELGGFVDKATQETRNPVTPHLIPLFHQLFCYIKVNLEIWQPEYMKLLSEGFTNAYNFPVNERTNIMGFMLPKHEDPCLEPNKVIDPLERMQTFLMKTHETWCQILGLGGKCFGAQYYAYPHLVEYILHSVVANLNHIADWRLRYVVKIFLRNFIINAPPECTEAVILPIVNHFCPFMLERLSARWQYVCEQIENGIYDESCCDTQEAFEDLMIRSMTREYIDVIKCLLLEYNAANGNDDELENESENTQNINNIPCSTISARGQIILRCDPICQAIFTTLLKCLWWGDTSACLKSINILELSIKWLASEGSQHLNEAAVEHILMSVFRGLHIHGQHDANLTALLTLGLHIYEIMLPIFPNLKEVLCKLPGVSLTAVVAFENFLNSMANSKQKINKVNKLKKEAFRDIVNGVIGKSRSEDMKLPVNIVDLPPMFKAPRPKQPDIMLNMDSNDLKMLFG